MNRLFLRVLLFLSLTAAGWAQITPPAPTITSDTTGTYGTAYTATASDGPSTGALTWARTGGTAPGGAIDASTGAVTTSGSGTVIIKVMRAGDGTYNPSPYSSTFSISFAKRAITVTRSGSKSYDGTTAAPGAAVAVTTGSLAPGDELSTSMAVPNSFLAGAYSLQPNPLILNATSPTTRDSAYTVSYVGNYMITKVPITVTLGGTKVYDGTTTPTGATATITSGTLATDDTADHTIADPSSPNAGSYTNLTTTAITGLVSPTTRTGSYSISRTGSYVITKAEQEAPTITSATTATYGTTYTATATGGSGSGALSWGLGTGSTAPNPGINSMTGVISCRGTGTVVIKVLRATSTNYLVSPYSADFTITVGPRPITVDLSGSKTYTIAGPNTTTPTGASATITSGSLASGDTISYTYSNTSSANPGSYPELQIATINNTTFPTTRTSSYTITKTGAYVINGVPTTFGLSSMSFTYNGSAQGPSVTASPSGATFTTGGTLSATAIGSYTATATATGLYGGSDSSLNWSINPETVPPSAPTSLLASNLTGTGATISWTASTDNVAVTLYEVLVDGVAVGTTASTSFNLTALSPGTHYVITVRARDASNNWSTVSSGFDLFFEGLPFIARFEPTEGYTAGALDGQNAWVVTGSANVVTTPVSAGTQAVAVPAAATPSFAVRTFANSTGGVTFSDLFAQPAAAAPPDAGVFFETDAAEVSLTASGTQGNLQAFDGNGAGGGTWVATGVGPTVDGSGKAVSWLHLTVRSDYTAKKWDLYYNGQMIAANLGFLHDTSTAMSTLALGGHATVATGFDDLLVAFENPLFTDADKDGIDDAWETAHGMNPATDDRDGDVDSDGISNVREYILGTNPNAIDSDGDGLTDAEELVGGTNPAAADSDGDTMPDGWEVAHGLNPASAADAAVDTDGDGLTNAQEFAAGSNPLDYYNGRAFATGTIGGTPGITYAYDASGRLVSATYLTGGLAQFTRDAASNLTAVAATNGGYIVTWRIAHSLSADGTGTGADAYVVSGDGLPNLVKYAFGLDPHVAVPADQPVVGRLTVGADRYLTLTYRRPDAAPSDLVYTVEVSADGTTWTSTSGATVAVSNSSLSGITTIKVRDATPSNGSTITRRIRLKIERKVSS